MIRPRLAPRLFVLFCVTGLSLHAATTGALVDRQGRPVAGATVRALPIETRDAAQTRIALGKAPSEPLGTATSDARGKFSLDANSPYFRIVVEAKGYAPLVEMAERNEAVGALLLEAAESVTVALEGDGKPVAGAIIRTGGQEVSTDEQGSAVLTFAKGSGGAIWITHPQWAPFSRTFRRAADLQKRISLNRGVAVRGSVETTAGEPAPGAAIEIDGFPAGTSDERGSFVLAHASPDWKQLTATKGDDLAVVTRSSAAGYRLRLARGASISGQVVDAKTQLPIVGAPVLLSEDRPGIFTTLAGMISLPGGLTDAKGRFQIARVLPGTYRLLAQRTGYEAAPLIVEVRSGERAEKTINAQRLARVSGVVLDEERKPVAAAAIRVESEDVRRQMLFAPGAGGPMPPPPPPRFASSRPTWSSADGEWVIREAPVDREAKLEAVRPGLPRGESDPMKLASGEKREKVVLVIPRGITVTGRVLTRDGAPLPNATVEARPREQGAMGNVVRIVQRVGGPAEVSDGVTTGTDGTFTMQLARGTYDFVADGDGYAAETLRAIDVQGDVEPLTFALGESVVVTGRVVRADGSGIPDVSVNAMGGSARNATTGPDGSFTIEELAPGTIQLMAIKIADYIREVVTVDAPASNVEIRIPAGGTIRGRVLEKGTKKPVADFRAGTTGERRGAGLRMILPPNVQPFRSEDGSFELPNVPAGPVELVAEAAGYVPGTANVVVEEGKATEEVIILLEAGTRISGRVTSPEGTPVSGASISLDQDEDEVVPQVTRRSMTATTDGNGEYTLAGVAAGERSIRANHDSYPLLVREANVSGREMRLDLQFPRGTDVTGTVEREGGGPVAGAQVSASTAAQGAASKGATTDSNGNFRIEGLAPGRYTFFVRAEGASETLRDVDIATSGPIRITLKAGATITGRVTGLPPSEMSSANVNVSSSSGFANAPVRADGTFRVDGAPAGAVRVVATTGGGGLGSRRQSATKTVEVAAGAEAYVDLEFASGNRITGRVTRGGVPVDGASVMFNSPSGSGTAAVRTNTRGEYTIEGLEDGTYTVVVMDIRTMASHREDYTVRGAGTFDIQMATAAVRGRVIDRATQDGIANVSISLDSDQQSGVRFPQMQTDASGAFRLEGVAPGSYRLRATRSGYGQEVMDLSVSGEGAQDVEVRMSRSDGVQIRVVDRRDGRPLNAFFSVADAAGRLALEKYLSQGDDTLSLAAGSYRVAVSVSGYAPAVVDVRSPGGPYNVALSPGGSLRIESSSPERRRARIVDSSGRPIVRGRINAPPEMMIDPTGATITAMEPGAYAIEILDTGGAVASRKTFTIVEGQTTTVRI
jgi:protocatechuate 3,4-dioxygenase beta subunit